MARKSVKYLITMYAHRIMEVVTYKRQYVKLVVLTSNYNPTVVEGSQIIKYRRHFGKKYIVLRNTFYIIYTYIVFEYS